MKKINIRAIEKYLPGSAVHSDALEEQLHLPKGWIEKNSGVVTRYWARNDESVSLLGAKALRRALAQAQLDLSDIDLLIAAGASYDYPVPFNAALMKQQLDTHAAKVPCFDVDSTCLSFLHALDIAHLYLMHRNVTRIAIVSAELASRSLNPQDYTTYTLFGDAAVAVILESSTAAGYTPVGSCFRNYTEGVDWAKVAAGGAVEPGNTADPSLFYFQMQGKSMIRLTLEKLDGFKQAHVQQTQREWNAHDFILPHQTSRIGNELFMRKYDLNPERVIRTLADYGNCISASIPLCLEKLCKTHQLREGTSVLLAGSAAGLSLGAVSLQF